MMLKTIKIIKELNCEKSFKIKMVVLGVLQQVANCYKILLKLPFWLIGCLACGIGYIMEQIADLMDLPLEIINGIPLIRFHKQEDQERLCKLIRNRYKEPVHIIKKEDINFGKYEEAKAHAEEERRKAEEYEK